MKVTNQPKKLRIKRRNVGQKTLQVRVREEKKEKLKGIILKKEQKRKMFKYDYEKKKIY